MRGAAGLGIKISAAARLLPMWLQVSLKCGAPGEVTVMVPTSMVGLRDGFGQEASVGS